MAADVADQLDLDRVLWIPARQPPHKPADAPSPAGIRLEMVHAAVRADPRFAVSTVELERDGPSYTVDTARALRAASPDAELLLIIGVDQFRELATWHEPDELVRLVRLVVMDRGGESGRGVAADLPGGLDALFVPVGRVDVSGTAVRGAVRAGEDVGALVPAGVAAVIERERLYSDS